MITAFSKTTQGFRNVLHFKATICQSDPHQYNLFYVPISKHNSSSDKMFFLTRCFQKQVINQSIFISYCDRWHACFDELSGEFSTLKRHSNSSSVSSSTDIFTCLVQLTVQLLQLICQLEVWWYAGIDKCCILIIHILYDNILRFFATVGNINVP